MLGRWRSVVVLSLSVSALIVAACGGGGSSKSTPTKASAPTSASSGGNVTPFPTPLLNGNQINSKKGYTATLPEGWKVRANLVQTADASVDAFFEPLQEGARVQANISVNCVVIKAPDPAKRTEALKTNTARQGLNKDIQESQRKISGVDASVLTYRFVSQQDSQSPQLDKQDIIFSNNKCDWMITTTTLAGDRAKYQATFDAFLDSFKLVP
jgi:hypothetical protein